jgi:major vault protein
MIRGPTEYVPPVEVEVLSTRRAIPLDDNEGIYVRDVRSGKVRAVVAQTYMLKESEELWEKDLTPNVEALVLAAKDPADVDARPRGGAAKPREKTRVVTYRVPHNAAMQV